MRNNVPSLFVDESECCGCSVCADACNRKAIVICQDKYGFCYPKIDETKCIGCGRCTSVCDFSKIDDFSLFKVPQKAFAAVNPDEKILKNSSSGGVFYALASYVIDNNGCVFGCTMSDKFVAEHQMTSSLEGLSEMQKSKYIQSNTEGIYSKVESVVNKGKLTLFVGTPCQVAALYKFLGGRKIDNLITIDLVCHGVTSPLFFQKYIRYMEKITGAHIVEYNFRSKKYGWGKNLFEMKMEKKGRVYSKCFFGEKSIFHAHYLRGNNMRPSDYVCKYATEKRVGDITIGDFWGFDKNVHLNFNNGLSCCLVNSITGQRLLDMVSLKLQEVPINTVISGNMALKCPTKKGKYYQRYHECFTSENLDALASELTYVVGRKRMILSYLKIIMPLSFFVCMKSLIHKII